MDPLTGFVSIVSLIGLFRAERRAQDAARVEDFLSWLNDHNHHELVSLIQQTQGLQERLQGIVEGQQQEVLERLDRLYGVLLDVTRRVEGFESMVQTLPATATLSDQAVGILRQLNSVGASKMLEISHFGSSGPSYVFFGNTTEIQIPDPRFIEDDMMQLVDLGLMRLDYNPQGSKVFVLTRAGAAVGGESL